MRRERQNNHEFPLLFLVGHSTDAIGGKCDSYTRKVPSLNFRDALSYCDSQHRFSFVSVLVERDTDNCSLLPSMRQSLHARAFQFAVDALDRSRSRSILPLGIPQAAVTGCDPSQITFIASSKTSNAPAPSRNSMSSGDSGISVSSVLSNRGVLWGHHRVWWNSTPENPNDKIVRARTKLKFRRVRNATLIELQLPFPPSANRLWRRSGLTIHKSSTYTTWLREAGWQVIAQKRGGIAGPYTLHIQAKRPDKRRRDIDNLIKPISDLLMSVGAVGDDSYCELVSARWVTTGEGVTVRIERAVTE